ncbi:MAG: hypothetical protein GY833_27135, partial [Aestuariibacter sp.]|nr:hypothetical protein [Aestuariibacter sp.]
TLYDAIIQGTNVSVSSDKFGTYSKALNLNADNTYIKRLTGNIIIDSTGIGSSISIRGPPDSWGSILYNRTTNLTLDAENVIVSGSEPTYFYGDITFSNFTCATPGKTIYFEAGKTFTFLGNTNIQGESSASGLIHLFSSQKGSPWYIDIAAYDISCVGIGDSHNIGITDIAAKPKSDFGGNIGWAHNDTLIWDGGGADPFWSTALNWNTDSVPAAADTVQFDSTSTEVSVVDADFNGTNTVATFNINSGYTGTITLETDLTVTGTYTQNEADSTFNETEPFDGNSVDQNTYSLSAGTFTLTAGTFRGATGSTDEAIRVADGNPSGEEFEEITSKGVSSSYNYVQYGDITLSGSFTPIGSVFAGTYNGNEYTVTNVDVNSGGTNSGTFRANSGTISNMVLINVNIEGSDDTGGLVGENTGTIFNITMTNVDIDATTDSGGLIGYNNGGAISSITMTDVDIDSAGNDAGGLIGENSGPVSDVTIYGSDVQQVSGYQVAGGLIGNNSNAAITNCTVNGTTGADVYLRSYANCGGLIGKHNTGAIANCHVTGDLAQLAPYTTGGDYFGGLIGHCTGGPVTNSSASPTVSISGNGNIAAGGLIGYVTGNCDISDSFATGNVTTGDSHGGGLVGWIFDTLSSITDCYATGNVRSTTNTNAGDYLGGLVGYNKGAVTDSYATGDVTGDSTTYSDYLGGLIGYNVDGVVTGCYAEGNIITGGDYIGGLIGRVTSTTDIAHITNCYATGNVTGYDDYVGGLVGNHGDGDINTSYATGTVISTTGGYVGGLVGGTASQTISNCYATGDVTGKDHGVGGFAGSSSSTITNCYSNGDVTNNSTANDDYTGGFVGYFTAGTLNDCFATGSTSGKASYVGGFAGRNLGTISATSFWYKASGDTNPNIGNGSGTVTAIEDADGGLSYFKKQTSPPYDSWDFTRPGDWIMCGYAHLQMEAKAAITNEYQLQMMLLDLDLDYTLANDIDASGTSTWNWSSGTTFSGFVPVGIFTGTLNGNGYTVTDLSVWNSANYSGLFGYTNGATIQNVGMITASINSTGTPGNYSGALAGQVNAGAVTECYSTGTVKGAVSTGGLVGYLSNSSSVTNSYSEANVTGTNNVGGLVGESRTSSSIANSYATGGVTGSGADVGGLVGENNSATISKSYSTGAVSGGSNEGGLCGLADDQATDITNSFWDTQTSGRGSSDGGTGKTTAQMKTLSTFTDATWTFTNGGAGGVADRWYMCGYPHLQVVDYSTTITNVTQLQMMILDLDATYTLANDIDASATSAWNYSGSAYLGFEPVGSSSSKFTGIFDGTSENIYTVSNLTIARATDNIGLFGYASGATIQNMGLVDASITVTGAADYVGALVGTSDASSTITNCYSTGSVTVADDYVGGLIGKSDSSAITNCYTVGSVSGDDYVGGLIGENNASTVTNCYSVATAAGGDYIGALIGYNSNSSSVNESYAIGAVTATATKAGGLVGESNASSITNCYAQGNVSGTDYAGGLVGYNAASSSISKSYAAGTVSSTATKVGGLIGENNSSTIADSYATGNVTGDDDATDSVGPLAGVGGDSGVTNCWYAKGGTITNNGSGGVNTDGSESASDYTDFYSVSHGVYTRASFTWNFTDGSGDWSVGNVSQYPYLQFEENVDSLADLQAVYLGNLAARYRQGSDIDLSGYFTPYIIGDATNKFTGTYNGSGYTIKDLLISTTEDYTGLFGYTSGATIENVNLVVADVEATGGGDYVGALIGRSDSSTIINCSSAGEISGDDYVGALIGESNASTVTKCYSAATVGGGDYVGGLIGYSSNSSSITKSCAIGAVTATATKAGGLVGENNASSITNCYAQGNVSGTDYAGGLVGYNAASATIGKSYATGTVTSTATKAGGLVGENNSSTIADSYATGNVTGDDDATDSVGPLAGVGGDGGVTNCWYANGGTITNNGSGGVNTDGSESASDYTDFYSAAQSVYVRGGNEWNFTASTGDWSMGNVSQYPYLQWEENVFTEADLQAISSSTLNLALRYRQGANIIITENFEPYIIGYSSSYKFIGSYNGSGYTITDLAITGTSNYVGLFGYTDGARIEKVGLVDVVITTGNYDYVGALVGYNYDSSAIIDCYSTGTISGDDYIGGLVGYNRDSSTITNSYSTVTLTGDNYTGGLVGYNYNLCTITDSYATGNVTANPDSNRGGLVGYNRNSTINSSYATGDVTGTSYTGGLVGYNYISSVINDSYATGAVTGTSYTGGLVGYNYNSCTIDGSYATGNVINTGNYTGGLVGQNNTSSDITNSYATGDVTASNIYAGGLAGYTSGSSTIDNCYATGNVTSTNNYVGGLVGRNSATLTDSYATGNVTGVNDGGDNVGPFSGDDGTITNCWYAKGSTITNNGTGGATNTEGSESANGKSDFYAKTQDVYVRASNTWNFTAVTGDWEEFAAVTFPHLLWENYVPPPNIEGSITGLGSGVAVSLAINKVLIDTQNTTSGGAFTFTAPGHAADDFLTIYVNNSGANYASLVGIAQNANGIADLLLQEDFFAIGDSDGVVGTSFTNATLTSAEYSSGYDLYTMSSGNVTFDSGITFWVPTGVTYVPGGNLIVQAANAQIDGTLTLDGAYELATNTSGTLDINGTFNLDHASAVIDLAGGIDISGALDATGFAATIEVAGDWVNTGTFTAGSTAVAFDGSSDQDVTSGGSSFYDVDIDDTGVRSVTFIDNVTANDLDTAVQGYSVAFDEDATITTDTTFLNTGDLVLGNGSDDVATFTGGLDTTGVGGTVTLAGTINTTDTRMDIGDATLATAVTLDTGNNAAGVLNVGAVTSGTNALTLDSGSTAGATIGLTSMADLTGGLTVRDAGGLVTIGAVGSGTAGNITITDSSAGVTFSSTVDASTVLITDTTDSQDVTFAGDLTVATLTTAAQGYDVAINGATNVITNDFNPINTGTLSINDGAGDVTTFTGGLNTTGVGGTVTLGGTINTTNTRMDIGAATLAVATILDTGNNAAGILNVGAITSAGNALTLDSGSTAGATIVLASMADLTGGLTVRDAGGLVTIGAIGSGSAGDVTITDSSAGVTFSSTVNADTLLITDTTDSQNVTFSGNLTAATLTTAAQGYDVAINGAVNTITNDCSFANTGTLNINDGAGDATTFTGGLDTTGVGGTVTLAGTINTTDTRMDIGDATLATAVT